MAKNKLEETLSAIRRQKAIYHKQARKEKDQKRLYEISRNIMELDKEEHKILLELGLI